MVVCHDLLKKQNTETRGSLKNFNGRLSTGTRQGALGAEETSCPSQS